MNLYDIKNPDFLHGLSIAELYDLSDEIREFLISSLSKTGGHLASNLGIVELTLALHYVFRMPEDRIFFDVGHQCYTHKILTGRASGFSGLRQYHGLSGFQKRSESEYDVWEGGHSSTSLSAALGMAVARDLDGKDYDVVPVIGDGALTSGMAFEALNQIGSGNHKVVIIFNDNNMSISKNVGAVSHTFSRLRASKGYTGFKNSLKRGLRKNELGEAIYSTLRNAKEVFKDAVIDGGIFEDFNLDYIGPIDGHDLRELIQTLEVAKEHEGPIVVHVMTQKGKGYIPSEADHDGAWHAVGPFDINTGKQLASVPAGSDCWAGIIADAVSELAETNEDITAITPAMITGSSLSRFFAKYPERSFDTGITEEHAATFAAGLAISGKRPFFAVYSSFMQRAYDQINHDICRMDLPVVIGVDHAGIVGSDGETHHGIFDIGLLTPLPNMIVAQPSDADEARNLVYTAFHQEHPFAIRYPKSVIKKSVHEMHEIPVGTWEMKNDSPEHRIFVLTYGEEVNRITGRVVSNALPVTVVNCRYLKPMDLEMLKKIAERADAVYTYESDLLVSGFGSRILEAADEENIPLSLRRFGLPDVYIQQGSLRQLRQEYHVDMNTFIEELAKAAGRTL